MSGNDSSDEHQSDDYKQSSLDALVEDLEQEKSVAQTPQQSQQDTDITAVSSDGQVGAEPTDTSSELIDQPSELDSEGQAANKQGSSDERATGLHDNDSLSLNDIVAKLKRTIARVGRGLVGHIINATNGESDPRKGLSGWFFPDEKVEYEEGEQVINADVPSRWIAIGPYILGGIFILAAILYPIATTNGWIAAYLNNRAPAFIEFSSTPLSWVVGSAFLLFFAALAITGEILYRASHWLVLTDRRVIYRENPFNRRQKAVRLEDINKIEEVNPFPERAVGIGTIEIYTASTDGAEIVFKNHPSPERSNDIEDLARQVTERAAHQQQPAGRSAVAADPPAEQSTNSNIADDPNPSSDTL